MITRLLLPLRIFLALLALGGASLGRAAVCTDAACVEIGGRLASVDSNRSLLLNALLGGLLGSSINLQIADWQALTSTKINLLDLLQAVQAEASLGTPQAALDTDVDALKIFTATAAALTAKGDTLAANAVLAARAKIGPGQIKLGELIDACASCVSYADMEINALELLTGEISLFNYHHMVNTPNPISISGSSIGLAALGSVNLYATVLRPALIVCRTAGVSSKFYGAAIRIRLDVALVSVDLSSLLNVQIAGLNLGSIANVAAQLTHVSVYATIARAEGYIQSVNALSQVVNVQATPGVVDLYVGQISDTFFWDKNRDVQLTDLNYGTIGALQLSALGNPIGVAIKAKASFKGQAASYQPLLFSGSFPQQQTVSTSTTFITNTLTQLLNTLDIQLEVTSGLTGLGVLTGTVTTLVNTTLGLIKPAVIVVLKVVLVPVLDPLLSSLLDPALSLLGIRLGEAYVTVLSARRRCTYTIAGTVYKDSNRNGFMDGAESGTSLASLQAKLILESAPTTVLQAVVLNTTTGAYSFSGVAPGTYRIVIDDNGTLNDVTPINVPTGWTALEQPTLIRVGVAITSDLPNQNFGLIDATTLSGRVFRDSGTGSGVANDGIRNGTEAGLGSVTLKLLDVNGTVLDTITTAADGTYQLYISASIVTGSLLRVVETNLVDEISTGASVGNTGGTYQRASDTLTFTHTSGTLYVGVNFGDVPTAQFTTDGQQTALPGAVVFYSHKFIASSAGAVSFTVSHTADPAIDGWSEVLYLDSNGNGQVDSGENPIAGPTVIAEGQTLNLVLKVSIPTAGAYGAKSQTLIRADVSYSSASPVLTQALTHTDLTIIGANGTAGLTLVKTVDKTTALPGDVITYTVAFTNQSSATLRSIVVADATPAFTKFVSATVGGANPASLGSATISAPTVGGRGTIRWTFSGDLAASLGGTVVFVVQVEQ